MSEDICKMKKEDLLKKWKEEGECAENLLLFAEESNLQEVLELEKELGAIYVRTRNRHRRFDECYLELEYPEREEEANLFFASPEIVSENRAFYGCFCIHIKADFSETGNMLERLYTYMQEHKEQMKFILVVRKGGKNVRERYQKLFGTGLEMACYIYEPSEKQEEENLFERWPEERKMGF